MRSCRMRCAFVQTVFLVSFTESRVHAQIVLEWCVAGPPAVAAAWLPNSPTPPTMLPLMGRHNSKGRVNKHYFVTSMTMRLWITVSTSSTWRRWPHEDGTIQARWLACKATLKRGYGVTCRHLPSYVDEYIWRKRQHDAEGIHVCGFLGYLAHHQVEIRK